VFVLMHSNDQRIHMEVCKTMNDKKQCNTGLVIAKQYFGTNLNRYQFYLHFTTWSKLYHYFPRLYYIHFPTTKYMSLISKLHKSIIDFNVDFHLESYKSTASLWRVLIWWCANVYYHKFREMQVPCWTGTRFSAKLWIF